MLNVWKLRQAPGVEPFSSIRAGIRSDPRASPFGLNKMGPLFSDMFFEQSLDLVRRSAVFGFLSDRRGLLKRETRDHLSDAQDRIHIHAKLGRSHADKERKVERRSCHFAADRQRLPALRARD